MYYHILRNKQIHNIHKEDNKMQITFNLHTADERAKEAKERNTAAEKPILTQLIIAEEAIEKAQNS
jgi:hypothetical protein